MAYVARDDAGMGSAMRMDLGSERGTTLLETAFAATILMVAMIGLASMSAIAVKLTENHGHLEARTVEYSQDKMEHLLALAYTDGISDTTYFPAASSGGSGLAVGGSSDPAAPVNGYIDWLTYKGDMLHGGTTAPADWFYKRVWKVEYPAGTTGLKQITIVTTARSAIGGEMIPKSTMIGYKAATF